MDTVRFCNLREPHRDVYQDLQLKDILPVITAIALSAKDFHGPEAASSARLSVVEMVDFGG